MTFGQGTLQGETQRMRAPATLPPPLLLGLPIGQSQQETTGLGSRLTSQSPGQREEVEGEGGWKCPGEASGTSDRAGTVLSRLLYELCHLQVPPFVCNCSGDTGAKGTRPGLFDSFPGRPLEPKPFVEPPLALVCHPGPHMSTGIPGASETCLFPSQRPTP